MLLAVGHDGLLYALNDTDEVPSPVGMVLVRIIDTDGSQDRRAAAIDIDQMLFRPAGVAGAAAASSLQRREDSPPTEDSPVTASGTKKDSTPVSSAATSSARATQPDSPGTGETPSIRQTDESESWAALVDALLASDDPFSL